MLRQELRARSRSSSALSKGTTTSSDPRAAARSCSLSRKQWPSRQVVDAPSPAPRRADAITPPHDRFPLGRAIELATGFIGDDGGDSALTGGQVLCHGGSRAERGGPGECNGDEWTYLGSTECRW